jgi:hypothetical protein
MKRLLIGLLAATAALAGCATSSQARSVQPSGFLGEYRSLLKSGKPEDEALKVYKAPGANWAGYNKILLEPVTIWADPKWVLTSEQQGDLRKVVEAFYATLRKKLSADYEMISEPAPGAMRMQFAITKGRPANTTFRIASKAVPYSAAANAIWTLATGKPAFVGDVSIEYIVKDASDGTLLTAGADRRVGGDAINKQFFRVWGDVEQALDYWTDAAVYWLCVLRGGAKCVRPEAAPLPIP